jgi:hypothetical protein
VGVTFSQLPLLQRCLASVRLQAQMPVEPDTDRQAEGTVAHVVAQSIARKVHYYGAGEIIVHQGKDWPVDEDMIEGAELYSTQCSVRGRFEEPVGTAELSGRPDWFDIVASGPGHLYVVDYKYGHKPVDVFENWQLIGEAVMIGRHVAQAPTPAITALSKVHLIIVQPRAYHQDGPVRTWSTDFGRLETFYRDTIEPILQLAQPPTSPASAGGHCLTCKARSRCEVLRYATAGIVDFTGEADLHGLPAAVMGQELRMIVEAQEILKARFEALHAHAEAAARAGQRVPFWSMQPGRGRKEWTLPVQTIASMATGAGLNVLKPPALITPTQAVKAGMPQEVVDSLSQSYPGAMSLKPDTHTNLRKVFSHE